MDDSSPEDLIMDDSTDEQIVIDDSSPGITTDEEKAQLLVNVPATSLDVDAPFSVMNERFSESTLSLAESLACASDSIEDRLSRCRQRFDAMDNMANNYKSVRPLIIAWAALNFLNAGATTSQVNETFSPLLSSWDNLRRYMHGVRLVLSDGPALLQDYMRCLPFPVSVFRELTTALLEGRLFVDQTRSAIAEFRSSPKHPRWKAAEFKKKLNAAVSSEPLSLSAPPLAAESTIIVAATTEVTDSAKAKRNAKAPDRLQVGGVVTTKTKKKGTEKKTKEKEKTEEETKEEKTEEETNEDETEEEKDDGEEVMEQPTEESEESKEESKEGEDLSEYVQRYFRTSAKRVKRQSVAATTDYLWSRVDAAQDVGDEGDEMTREEFEGRLNQVRVQGKRSRLECVVFDLKDKADEEVYNLAVAERLRYGGDQEINSKRDKKYQGWLRRLPDCWRAVAHRPIEVQKLRVEANLAYNMTTYGAEQNYHDHPINSDFWCTTVDGLKSDKNEVDLLHKMKAAKHPLCGVLYIAWCWLLSSERQAKDGVYQYSRLSSQLRQSQHQKLWKTTFTPSPSIAGPTPPQTSLVFPASSEQMSTFTQSL